MLQTLLRGTARTTAVSEMRPSNEQQTHPVWGKFILIPPLLFPQDQYSPYIALESSEMAEVVSTEVCSGFELSWGQVLFLNSHFSSLFIENRYEVHEQNQSEESLGMGGIAMNIFSISSSLVLWDTSEMLHPLTGIYFSIAGPGKQRF